MNKLLLFLLFIPAIMAWQIVPPTPITFEGMTHINNYVAGSEVSLWENNQLIDSVNSIDGYYHDLKLNWDDPDTEIDEGVTYNATKIILKVNGVEVKKINISNLDAGNKIIADLYVIQKITENPSFFIERYSVVLLLFLVLGLFLILRLHPKFTSCFLLLLLLPSFHAWQTAPLPAVSFNGIINLPDNLTIELYSENTFLDQSLIQFGDGYFHNLDIIWDDPDTLEDEGVSISGETVIFKVEGYDLQNNEYYISQNNSGQIISVNLTATKIVTSSPVISKPSSGGGGGGGGGGGAAPIKQPEITFPTIQIPELEEKETVKETNEVQKESFSNISEIKEEKIEPIKQTPTNNKSSMWIWMVVLLALLLKYIFTVNKNLKH